MPRIIKNRGGFYTRPPFFAIGGTAPLKLDLILIISIILNMKWTVMLSRQAAKQLGRLPLVARKSVIALMREIEIASPVRGNWPNYGSLG